MIQSPLHTLSNLVITSVAQFFGPVPTAVYVDPRCNYSYLASTEFFIQQQMQLCFK